MNAGLSGATVFHLEYKMKLCENIRIRWFIAALSAVLLQAAGAQTDKDLLGYWPFDKGDGATAVDQVGGNDVELIGNPVWTKNISGYCLLFNGSDNKLVYGKLMSHKGYRGNVECGTISVWARAVAGGAALTNDPAGRARVISVGFPHATLVGILNGHWCAIAYDGRFVEYINGPPVVNDQWTYLVITWDEVFARFYVNGKEINEGGPYLRYNVPGSGVTSWTSSYVASHVPRWGQMFKGYIDDWKLFKRALPPEKIAAEYNREKGKRSINTQLPEAGIQVLK